MNTTTQQVTVLTKVKAGDVCKHLARILGASDFEIQQKSESDLDISGLTIKTDRGTVKFSAGSYGGEFNVHVTIPRTVHRLNFVTLGDITVSKDFESEKEMEQFISEKDIQPGDIADKIEVTI